jgi:hypothetical protein
MSGDPPYDFKAQLCMIQSLKGSFAQGNHPPREPVPSPVVSQIVSVDRIQFLAELDSRLAARALITQTIVL